MLPPRFYIPDAAFLNGQEVVLPTEEAHHAVRVLRLVDGDTCMVFNGQGAWALGPLRIYGKNRAAMLSAETGEDPLPRQDFLMACAWPQSAAVADEIVARAVDLGVDRVTFWRAERSQHKPALSQRMARVAVASCKQCGRNRLPALAVAARLEELLAENPSRFWLAAVEPGLLPHAERSVIQGDCGVVIGPEGGFTRNEAALLRDAGAVPISLGPQVLRTEVAAVTACALVLNALGRLGTRLSAG